MFSRGESTVVGQEVGNMGCCRIGFAGAGLQTFGRVGRPDCLTLSFYFALSWKTRLLEVVWMNSTTPEYSSGSLSIQLVSTKFQQKFGETDWDERELVIGTF